MIKVEKIFILLLIFLFSFSLFLPNISIAKDDDDGESSSSSSSSSSSTDKGEYIAKGLGLSTLKPGTNNPEPWVTKLARWSFIVFIGIFFTAILIGGTLYAIMPQGNQWKDNGLKMIQGAIISAVLALGSGVLWGFLNLFFSN